MTSLCGKYVKTFAEASHALPDGMHMNADYPFMLPSTLKLVGRDIVLRGRDTDGRFRICKLENGREYCVITQSSSFEKMFGRSPAKFKAYPFKDERTSAVSERGIAQKP
jgi:hypothetical protein